MLVCMKGALGLKGGLTLAALAVVLTISTYFVSMRPKAETPPPQLMRIIDPILGTSAEAAHLEEIPLDPSYVSMSRPALEYIVSKQCKKIVVPPDIDIAAYTDATTSLIVFEYAEGSMTRIRFALPVASNATERCPRSIRSALLNLADQQ